MAPKYKSSDASNLDVPKKKSHKSATFKCKDEYSQFHKGEKNHMLRLLRSTVRMNLLWNCEGKEIHASFLSHLKLQKLQPQCVTHAYLKWKKALNLDMYVEFGTTYGLAYTGGLGTYSSQITSTYKFIP
jgi:hypothetical protein